jgi:linoleoyl-CoA desaturase
MATLKIRPRFVNPNKTDFFSVLQKRVNDYFVENKIAKQANGAMVAKTVILLSAYILPFLFFSFIHVNTLTLMLLYAFMGFALAGIGMSIMHDACHGSYSRNQTVNDWLGYSLNLIGGMVYNWKLQHNVLHHTYTNVAGVDDDIDDKLILRFSPHNKLKKIHRAQFLYVFFFYGILTLYWVFAKDLVQHYRYKNNGVNMQKPTELRTIFWKMIALKVGYLAYIFLIPFYFGGYTVAELVCGFLLMHGIGGMVLGITFQMAHSVEEADFPLPNDKNIIENDWAIHQMETTVNFARDNKFVSWYVGGLNYQVEHHLFPNICHVHYPQITEIVKQTALEYGVPYKDSPSVWSAFRSHVRMVRRLGYDFNLDLATM